ncbi:P-type conjugative transfer protein TrbG [Cupriavidus metallidurans]|uniref:P-type conjugative transfer protein TrbG n=1 Tax=Cupriavidus metallidurans TaxID=119219 RepID=UPI000CE05D73|nr:P-type conjugative transfer protein TrbG [Cupriavidus metallidurans]AVA38363.1 P-type conjugative transfer protein TrbG [Cupriavidus metallidurans]
MSKKLILAAFAAVYAIGGMSAAYAAGQRYNVLDDAVLAQAKRWQSGEKAKALMSSDGKVIFPFGQAMPKLTCSPSRACDIEMEPGEMPRKVVLGDSANWTWEAADSIEKGRTVNHVVVQPKDNDIESNLIITTDRRTYHIKLYAPKTEGVYLNRIGFYYPEQLVSSWDDKMGRAVEAKAKDEASNVMPAAVAPDKMAFDYRIDGDADFRPIRVFNDGERVYIAMPDEIRHSEYPTLRLIDEEGKAMVVDYRRTVDEKTGTIHYVVDKLFSKAELIRDSEKVQIIWKRKEKSRFVFWGRG